MNLFETERNCVNGFYVTQGPCVFAEGRDEFFTKKIAREMSKFFKNHFYQPGFMFSISERFKDEGMPHYKCGFLFDKVSKGAKGFCEKTILEVEYQAKKPWEEKLINGIVVISFWAEFYTVCPFCVPLLFYFYDQAIREYYPEWVTNYKLSDYKIR